MINAFSRTVAFILFILCIHTGIAQPLSSSFIIQKPIAYNQKRIALSLEYLEKRHGIKQQKPTIVPSIIVLHYTGSGNLAGNFAYFNKEEIENARKLNKDQSTLNVSAHYLVDRDGKVYQLVPDTLFARHAIGINYCSIGVENIGSKKEPLTDKQVQANIQLVKYLCSKYKINYLIGHSEYTRFKKTPIWKETNPEYITYKEDPGSEFMQKVRLGLTGYTLKDRP